MQDEYLDADCGYRAGFDYELRDELSDHLDGDDFDFGDDDQELEWDDSAADEELVSMADTRGENLFDVGAVLPQPVRPPHQIDAFDLGIEELELELDLAGGVFELDASVTGSLDESLDGLSTSLRPSLNVRGPRQRWGSVRMMDHFKNPLAVSA